MQISSKSVTLKYEALSPLYTLYSLISTRLSLSMLSSLFQGMLISPSIIGSSSCWSKVVMCSENSSRKTLIGVPFFVELGGL